MDFKVLCFLLIVSTANAELRNYEGFKVYKVIPKTNEEVSSLINIQKLGITEFWDDDFNVNHDVRIMVSTGNEPELVKEFEKAELEANVVIDNVQRAIDNQLDPNRRPGGGSSGGSSSGGSGSSGGNSGGSSSWKPGGGGFSLRPKGPRRYRNNRRNPNTEFSITWDRYYDLNAIYAWLDELAVMFPNIVKTVVIGTTVENREIKGVIINFHPERTNKLIGMFEGGLHAREWISPATVTWIIKEFLVSDDPEVIALAENFEWHIFPVVNPDGYSYTFTNHRMWRKNRSRVNTTSCAASGVDDDMSNGVDLNRNFEYMWMTVGASNDPCSNTFAGPSPASEPETRAIAQYVQDINNEGTFIYYIAFHSYTQLMIIPYSHLTSSDDVLQAENYGDMYEIAIRGASKLQERYGTTYSVGISANVMYPMSGTSFDWVKNAINVPVTYLIELRDLGNYGFLLPAEEIIPNNIEVMDALLEMDRATRELNYYAASANSLSPLFALTLGTMFLFMR